MSSYKKRRVPDAVRREVLRAAGGEYGTVVMVHCHYCSAEGVIAWTLSRSWPTVTLELDHVIPEFKGGPSTADNIVLACRRCNRSKGHKMPAAPEVVGV